MTEEWLLACLRGIGAVFLNPLLYTGVLFSLLMGLMRVKRERRDFNIRVYPSVLELRHLLSLGLMLGLIISLVTLGAGLVVPIAAVVLISAAMLFLSLFFSQRLLSPAYTAGLGFIALFLYERSGLEMPFFQEAFEAIDRSLYPTAAVLLGLLLIAEGILIARSSAKKPSPGLTVSKRGQTVGTYESRRLWLLPLFLLVPGGDLPAPFDWYPVFSISGEPVMPIVVPFLLGYSRKVRSGLPAPAMKGMGRKVIVLGTAVTLLAAAGQWYGYMAPAAVAAAVFARLLLECSAAVKDKKKPFYFSQSKLGVRILAVIPRSPADKMGLAMGEVVTKINGIHVTDEREFYRALQKNRAHCKLEVVGNNEQIRFVQRALFEGEHHELGILFTEDVNRKEAGKTG